MTIALDTLPPRVRELLSMLTYRRPGGSKSERKFIERFITPLGVAADAFGNLWKTVGTGSPILWSSHTDTVHKAGGPQHIEYGAGFVTVSGSNCLGADCTVGVWIMMNMIRAGVPGTYVFHRLEERGGQGSSHIAKHTPERLAGINYAIAFDRRGTGDIITHQGFARTASAAFARSLASTLMDLQLRPCDGGVFTDTANYAHLIPECTNVSVGYFDEHTTREMLAVEHATALLDNVLSADWSQLVCERDPALPDPEDDWINYRTSSRASDDVPWKSNWTLEDHTMNYPREVAEFLEAHGFTWQDIEDFTFAARATHRRVA